MRITNIQKISPSDINTIDYCIYIDTDSVFYSATPLIEYKYPNNKFTDIQMSSKILEIANEVQSYINNSYNYFAKKFCNIENHRFEIKQEVIAKSGLFIAKKRYAMKIINDNGIKVNKLLIKGIDIVRSNFAPGFRVILQSVLEDILAGTPKSSIDKRILDFKFKMRFMKLDEISTPTGVKGLWKYLDKQKKTSINKFVTTSSNQISSVVKKGAPVHVKAAISYNDLLKHYNLQQKYQYISNGDKIRYIYLKNNPFKLPVIAYKGYEDPEEILQYIKQYIDYEKIYTSQLEKKFKMMYSAMGWKLPLNKNLTVEKFF